LRTLTERKGGVEHDGNTATGAKRIAKCTMPMQAAKTVEHADEDVAVLVRRDLADGDAEHQREDHQRQHLAVERADSRCERVARDELHQDVAERLGGSRTRLQRRNAPTLSGQACRRERLPKAGTNQVDERHADGHRRAAQQHREAERLAGHLAEPVPAPELVDADDERGKHHRHDDHEDRAQEDLTDRAQHALADRLHRGRPRPGVGQRAEDQSRGERQQERVVGFQSGQDVEASDTRSYVTGDPHRRVSGGRVTASGFRSALPRGSRNAKAGSRTCFGNRCQSPQPVATAGPDRPLASSRRPAARTRRTNDAARRSMRIQADRRVLLQAFCDADHDFARCAADGG
jgi:hypothetical protein